MSDDNDKIVSIQKKKELALASFEPQTINEAMQLSTILAQSTVIPSALRGKPGDVFVVMATGRELGFSPMQSLRGISVIEGKPVLSADAMVALAIQHPDCQYFRVKESTATKATYVTKRRGEEETSLTWTIEMAQAAALRGKQNWQRYPEAMLRARCASALARATYPDAFMGVYVPDEAEEMQRGGGPIPPATPARSTVDAMTQRLEAQLGDRIGPKSAPPLPPPAQIPETLAKVERAIELAKQREQEEPPPPTDADAPPKQVISTPDGELVDADTGEIVETTQPRAQKLGEPERTEANRIRFGKNKDKHLPDIEDGYLKWMHGKAREEVLKGGKFADANARWLEQVELEVKRRGTK